MQNGPLETCADTFILTCFFIVVVSLVVDGICLGPKVKWESMLPMKHRAVFSTRCLAF